MGTSNEMAAKGKLARWLAGWRASWQASSLEASSHLCICTDLPFPPYFITDFFAVAEPILAKSGVTELRRGNRRGNRRGSTVLRIDDSFSFFERKLPLLDNVVLGSQNYEYFSKNFPGMNGDVLFGRILGWLKRRSVSSKKNGSKWSRARIWGFFFSSHCG